MFLGYFALLVKAFLLMLLLLSSTFVAVSRFWLFPRIYRCGPLSQPLFFSCHLANQKKIRIPGLIRVVNKCKKKEK
jgi:hypothetical protein